MENFLEKKNELNKGETKPVQRPTRRYEKNLRSNWFFRASLLAIMRTTPKIEQNKRNKARLLVYSSLKLIFGDSIRWAIPIPQIIGNRMLLSPNGASE